MSSASCRHQLNLHGSLRPCLALVLSVTITDAATGQTFRELTIEPTRDYQGSGQPQDQLPKRETREPAKPQVHVFSMS